MALSAELVRPLGDLLHNMLDLSDGKGYLVLFPLTEAAPAYQFVRGFFERVSPYARCRLLPTPRMDGRTRNVAHLVDGFLPTLTPVINPGVKHVRMVDATDIGRTTRLVQATLKKLDYRGSFVGPFDVLFRKIERHVELSDLLVNQPLRGPSVWRTSRLGWGKDNSGRVSNLLNHEMDPMIRDELIRRRNMLYHLGLLYGDVYSKLDDAS
ncbi:hypothetical protein HY994_05775 [Candidatus Micrarchaeota archaeon]|nr:hypothetical protein [Candidatus Micrarchaeota archaeon]